MSYHPINLFLRFLLELSALFAIGYWGWMRFDGPIRFFTAIGIPLVFAILWGTFAVPEDPSRSGKAPVPVPGWLRLALELAFFGFAAWTLYDTGAITLALIFAALFVIHYALSSERIKWLMAQ